VICISEVSLYVIDYSGALRRKKWDSNILPFKKRRETD
jgi:hypothetical protein